MVYHVLLMTEKKPLLGTVFGSSRTGQVV